MLNKESLEPESYSSKFYLDMLSQYAYISSTDNSQRTSPGYHVKISVKIGDIFDGLYFHVYNDQENMLHPLGSFSTFKHDQENKLYP